MDMHTKAVDFVLGNDVSFALSLLAFLLASLYVFDLLLVNNGMKRPIRKEGILLRIFNWAMFGVVFLLFGQIIGLKDIFTWRAAARIALLSLMVSEGLFEISTLIPAIKRALWKKET